ncbi:Cell division protein FtsZ [subsurface metagenome]
MAIIGLRAVDVPCSGDSSSHDIYFKLNHSDAKATIMEGEKQFSNFYSVIEDLPRIKNIILIDKINMFSEKEDAPEWTIPINFEENGKINKKLWSDLCSLINSKNKYIFLSAEAKKFLEKYLAESGASSIVAKIAKQQGILTIGVVTKPFAFEGKKRKLQADAGIEELKKEVDALITVSNDRLLRISSKDTSMKGAFEMADKVLRQSVQAIADLITIPGLINLDLADVRTVAKDAGLSLVGIGIGKGKKKAITAAKMAISSPLLEVSIKGAKSLLVNVTGGLDMSLFEVNEIVDNISQAVGADTNIVFGAIIDEGMKDEIRVSVIATTCEEIKEEEKDQNLAKINVKGKKDIEIEDKFRIKDNLIDDKDLEIPAFLRKRMKGDRRKIIKN